MKRTLFALLLGFGALTAAAADLAFSPSHRLILGEPAPRHDAARRRHDVASDGESFLVLFSETRCGGWTPPTTMRAARLRADGSTADPGGFVISPDAVDGRVEWNGREYLVVLRMKDDALAVVTLSGDGFTSAPRTIARDVKWLYDLRPRGEEGFVVFYPDRKLLLDRDGRPVAPPVDHDTRTLLPTASDPAGHVVLDRRNDKLQLHRLDANAQLRSSVTITTGTIAVATAAWDGSRHLVVWSNGYEIRARWVERDGTLSEPFRIGFHPRSWGDWRTLFLQPTPAGFLLLQHLTYSFCGVTTCPPQDGDLFAMQLGRGGTSQSGQWVELVPDGHANTPVTASNGRSALAVWDDVFRSEYGDIVTLLVRDGATLSRDDVRLLESKPTMPSIAHVRGASNGLNVLLVWQERRGRAAFGRFTLRGQPLDGTGLTLEGAEMPEAVTNGADYLMIWHSGTSSYARALSAGGAWLGSATPLVAKVDSVAWGGGRYVVLMVSPAKELLVQALRPDGSLDGQPVLIGPGSLAPSNPSRIAWTGAAFVITDAYSQQIKVLNADLTVLGTLRHDLHVPRYLAGGDDGALVIDYSTVLVLEPFGRSVAKVSQDQALWSPDALPLTARDAWLLLSWPSQPREGPTSFGMWIVGAAGEPHRIPMRVRESAATLGDLVPIPGRDAGIVLYTSCYPDEEHRGARYVFFATIFDPAAPRRRAAGR